MISLFFIFYLVVGLILLYFAIESFKQNNTLGKKLFRVFLAAIFVVEAYAFHLVISNYTIKSLLYSMVFSSVSFLSVFVYDFIYSYTEYPPKKNIKNHLYIIVIVETFFVLTNPWHELLTSYTISNIFGGTILKINSKFPLYIHLLFNYLVFADVIYLLIKKSFSLPKIYRIKYTVYIYSFISVIILNIIFLLSRIKIDISLFLYGIVATLIYIFTFQFKPYNLISNTYKLIFDNVQGPVALFDFENNIIQYNLSFLKSFENSLDIKTLKLQDFVEFIHLEIKENSKHFSAECNVKINNTDYYYDVDYTPLYDKKSNLCGVLIGMQNITEIKSFNKNLEKIATTDSLTGLYNKFYFDYYIENSLNSDNRLPVSVALVNINNLKFINNCFGTSNGDAAIILLSDIIKENINDNCFAARIYSEDIIIIMPNTSEKGAVEILNRIKQAYSTSKKFNFDINFEYGISTETREIANVGELISSAREIMTNKKMLNENSLKNSLLDSLKKSLIDSDFETEAHVERVNDLTQLLGQKLNLSEKELTQLSLLALLHDIGKIAIPDYILLKPGKLTDREWEIMKQHTTKGYRISNSYPELREISNLILSHHERWDGTGYPNGLKEDEIPLLSQIISVLDSYDVMTNDRPYHKAISKEEAINELKRCSGKQFSPKIVDEFICLINEKNIQK